jgi:hypothetical protein
MKRLIISIIIIYEVYENNCFSNSLLNDLHNRCIESLGNSLGDQLFDR